MNKLIVNETREFGDCIADGFKIIGRNFKAFISGFMIYVFPIIFLTFVVIYGLGKPQIENIAMGISSTPFFIIALYAGMILGFLMLCAVIYSIFIVYLENDNNSVQFSDIQPYVLSFFWKIIPVYALIIVLNIPIMILTGLATINPLTNILLFPAMIYFLYILTPSLMAPFIRIHENLSPLKSILRAFNIIKGHWWPSFGVIFIAFIISIMSTYVLSIPMYMIFIFKSISGLSTGTMDGGGGIWAGMAILIALIAYLFTSSYLLACTNLKYYDLLERKEGVSLLGKIEEFGNQKDSIFENEGEF